MINNQMLSKGTTLRGGDLMVDRRLSSGGFGNTYVVRNRLDKVFAMKEFFIKGVNLRVDGNVTVSVPDNKTTFESQRAKFEKEAKRLSKIDNPHIVKVHDLFYENGTVYYTMDYIDGESLADRIRRTGKPFTEDEATSVLFQVLDALTAVHGQGIYHMDLKPANIMQDKQGNVFLIDFGASKQLEHDENGANTSTMICHTPGYAPLEQVAQNLEQIGPWTDFYALGATLYNLLTNISPSKLTIGEAFSYPYPVSMKMRKLIEWMLQPSWKKRPQFVLEIKKKLGEPNNVKGFDDETIIDIIGKSNLDDEQTQYETYKNTFVNNASKQKKSGLPQARTYYSLINYSAIFPLFKKVVFDGFFLFGIYIVNINFVHNIGFVFASFFISLLKYIPIIPLRIRHPIYIVQLISCTLLGMKILGGIISWLFAPHGITFWKIITSINL